MTISGELRHKIAATVNAFEERYDNAKKTANEKPEVVAKMLCDSLHEIIRDNIVPCNEKIAREKIHPEDFRDITLSNELRMAHQSYINGILKSLRDGGIDYVYNPEWLCELYYYEPRVEFVYYEGAFLVRKGGLS